jgi:hypothetical protein
LKWNGISHLFPAKGGASKFLECGFFIVCSIEMEKVDETLDYYWGHLNYLTKRLPLYKFSSPALGGGGCPTGEILKDVKVL